MTPVQSNSVSFSAWKINNLLPALFGPFYFLQLIYLVIYLTFYLYVFLPSCLLLRIFFFNYVQLFYLLPPSLLAHSLLKTSSILYPGKNNPSSIFPSHLSNFLSQVLSNVTAYHNGLHWTGSLDYLLLCNSLQSGFSFSFPSSYSSQ